MRPSTSKSGIMRKYTKMYYFDPGTTMSSELILGITIEGRNTAKIPCHLGQAPAAIQRQPVSFGG